MWWVVNATPLLLYPRKRPNTHCIGGRVGPRADLDGCGKSLPYRYSIPDPYFQSNQRYLLYVTIQINLLIDVLCF